MLIYELIIYIYISYFRELFYVYASMPWSPLFCHLVSSHWRCVRWAHPLEAGEPPRPEPVWSPGRGKRGGRTRSILRPFPRKIDGF